MQSLPSVTFVVPTRNRAALLRGCLQSLIAQDYPADLFEIIVADDGSTDDTSKVVNDLSAGRESPALSCLKLEHVGVNGARNAGIMRAAGVIVCIIDDDELVQPTHLKSVVGLLHETPELSGVGGPCRPFGRSRVRTCGRCLLGASDFPGTGKRRVEWLLGGNMAVRKTVFSERGLFDQELSGYGDEYEWFQREPRLALLFDPNLWVYHRRDRQTLFQLCRSAWQQGTTIPAASAKVGVTASPSVLQVLRYLGHAVTRLCCAGVILACREAGALSGARGLRRSYVAPNHSANLG